MRMIDADALSKETERVIREYLSENTFSTTFAASVLTEFRQSVISEAPTIDAVPVVRCGECVSHGNCLTEDTFRIARIENQYCCGGKRREVDGDES